MESNSPPATKGTSSPVDMDKLRQKLQRAYQRRDYYAQLYFQSKAELDDTKIQLNGALNKIKQLQSTHMLKYKNDSLEHQNTRTDRVSPPDRNGRISPDSGAISMSPGVESTEGHGQLEDEYIENSEIRINRSNSKMNGMNGMNGMNESLNYSGEIRPTKRVAFRDVPPPTNSGPGSQHSSFERINGISQPSMQRSFTYDQGDFAGHYMDGGMNMKLQRAASYTQGRQIPPQMQYSTFPGSYPIPAHQQFGGSNYSLPPDQHRLPRVHRGMGYDGSMVPPMMNPAPYQTVPPPPRIIQHHQQQPIQHPVPGGPGLPPQQSAFQRVPKQNSFRMHHQYENITVHPSYYPQLPGAHPVHLVQSPPQDHQQQKPSSYGERWTYSGLTQEEFSQLLIHLSLPAAKVGRLEISRSNLGNPNMMANFCRELKKNSSIIELSLPNNDIGKEPLKTLLMTVSNCKNIKELKLVNNNIGEDCLGLLKQFLEHSSLKSFILAGNEIEHHTHLLDVQLPQELQYEVVSSDCKNIPPVSTDVAQNMKMLQI